MEKKNFFGGKHCLCNKLWRKNLVEKHIAAVTRCAGETHKTTSASPHHHDLRIPHHSCHENISIIIFFYHSWEVMIPWKCIQPNMFHNLEPLETPLENKEYYLYGYGDKYIEYSVVGEFIVLNVLH